MAFDPKNIKLVIGLGNPDKEYENTYHNVGFLFIDQLTTNDERRITKSTEYMNNSGKFVAKEMKKAGAQPTFWNVSFVGSKALAKELDQEGRGIQISQVVPFPWDASVPVVKEYRKLLADSKADQPGFGTLEGYIAAKVIVEGLRRAGRKLDRESFVRAMESMSEFDVGGFKVSYSPENHNGSKFVDLTIISKEQRFVR